MADTTADPSGPVAMNTPRRRIAIVGTGPTGLYTLAALIARGEAADIALFEKGDTAGVGMPYADDANVPLMLANIASIEIPPLGETYLAWLQRQPAHRLTRYGIAPDAVDERTFLPRILLGEYFRDQFLWLVDRAGEQDFSLTAHEACDVTDIDIRADGVWVTAAEQSEPRAFDFVVIATGHVWPDTSEATRNYFPSPWSGLVDADIPPVRVGILGTSLSAIDAAMAVASQHGAFRRDSQGNVLFDRKPASAALSITMMSRSGVLPEADFYCPIPYTPLQIATPAAVNRAVEQGTAGLLDRIFDLIRAEIMAADPAWADRVALAARTADDFATAYFADRKAHDPFQWAAYNLAVVEHNKARKITVAWRYAILRLHEMVHDVVPHLDAADRERFDAGLKTVFVDNYAAVPSETIRRLLALREAGIIALLDTGEDYEKRVEGDQTVIVIDGVEHGYDVYIDARGQRPLRTADLPFPTLRQQLLAVGDDIPDVGDDYALLAPETARGRVAFGALPYLIHDKPFIQGITASAEIGTAIGGGRIAMPGRARRRL